VAQHFLFAQQLRSHGFSLGVFVTIQGEAGNRTVALNKAITTAPETITVRSINILVAQFFR